MCGLLRSCMQIAFRLQWIACISIRINRWGLFSLCDTNLFNKLEVVYETDNKVCSEHAHSDDALSCDVCASKYLTPLVIKSSAQPQMKLTSLRFYHAFIQVWWKRVKDNLKSNKFNVLRVCCYSQWSCDELNLELICFFMFARLFFAIYRNPTDITARYTRFSGCNASHQMRAWTRKARRTFSKYTTNTEFCKWKIEKNLYLLSVRCKKREIVWGGIWTCLRLHRKKKKNIRNAFYLDCEI